MIRTDLLRGEMARAGYNQCQMAKELGITPKTFYAKMKRGVFDSDEIEEMIRILQLKNPMEIFFARKVS